MRKILLVVVLFCSAIGFAQNKNFEIKDRLIVWRLVYEDATPFTELKDNMRLSFVTDSTGTISKTNFGDRRLVEFTAEFRIESKEGKYRASVFNIRIFDEPVQAKNSINEYPIERIFLKNNGTIRKSILGYNLTERLNPHFEDLFTIKKVTKSDW